MENIFLLIFVLPITCLADKFDEDTEWMNFKKTFFKTYENKTEETERYEIWKENTKFIRAHNIETAFGFHSFTVGMNQFGDMRLSEVKEKMLGYKPELRKGAKNVVPVSNISTVDIPDTIDWRNKGYVTPVGNQGQCGSCWAFAANDAISAQNMKKTGKLVPLSVQNLVDCTQKYGDPGCCGGLMDNAFKYAKDNGGIDTEQAYPYEAKDGKCRFKAKDVGATDTGYIDLPKGNEKHLQAAVANVGPVTMAIDGQHQSFMFYKSGVYDEPKCTDNVNHAMLIVGYKKDNDEDAWIIKNSFGTNWGMDGYILMARNKNLCGLANEASYPTV